MNNVTKMRIDKPVNEVFEAIADGEQISNYWFSASSGRWEQGKTVTLKYEEYHAQVDIHVLEVEANRKIVFEWDGTDHVVTISFHEGGPSGTIVEVMEQGFDEHDADTVSQMVDNKEGWVYMLTCLKGYLEYGVKLRASLVK